jgi:lactate dehydrogenase-like 2-hydroxyacid dehydrogenase
MRYSASSIREGSIHIGLTHSRGRIRRARQRGSCPIRPTVLITKPLTPSCVAALNDSFEVLSILGAADPNAVMTENAGLIRGIAGGKVSAAMMEMLPRLEIIANSGVGVDTIDMPVARARGVAVTNTPDVLNDAVAELALGLMLALARAVPQADRFVRDGRWTGGVYPLGRELRGKTAGILGLGRIGKEIATRLTAMKMTIAYCGRGRQDDQPYAYYADPAALAAASDWLILAAPGGKATEKIVSRQVLEALGPAGFLVNVARGSLVDQDALIELLKAGKLGGAGLDVFIGEPQVPADLVAMDNVVLMPHQGGRTEEAREAVDRLVFDNLLAHFEGRPLLTRVP